LRFPAQYNPIKTIKTNTMGTLNMLGLARRVKARLLMASTSEIYGMPYRTVLFYPPHTHKTKKVAYTPLPG
jgi:nucleoside-diphosphate-sugar epimerase